MGTRQAQFEALVYAYGTDLYRYAYWLCRDRARAEDLVQETFLRAWRALSDLQQQAAAKSWLITIMRREHARIHARVSPITVSDIDPDTIAGEATPLLEHRVLHRALLDLSDEYREPLLLQVLGGLSSKEIALVMNIPIGTVLTRLYRARQKLRAELAGRADNVVHNIPTP